MFSSANVLCVPRGHTTIETPPIFTNLKLITHMSPSAPVYLDPDEMAGLTRRALPYATTYQVLVKCLN